jgi:Cu-processing system permease protein
MPDPAALETIETARAAIVAEANAAGARPFRAFAAVALFEFRMAARSRWTIASALAFAGVAVAISYFGLFGAGYLEFQGFERTAISLLSLVVFLAPLLGLVLGLGSFAGPEMLDLLFAQPPGRTPVVVGKLAGLSLTIAAAVATGLGMAGLLIASQVGADGIAGYLALVLVSIALGAIFAGIAAVCGLAFRDRLQASGAAIGAWAWFVFLSELVVLGVLFMVPEVSVRPLLIAAVFFSPVTLARVLVLLAVGAQPVLGPSGALLLRTFGETGAFVALAAGLIAWLVATWLGAAVIARLRDA